MVNWNGKIDTIDCMKSLKNLNYPEYEVVVVDNASTDGSQDLFKKEYFSINLIENKENLGFAEGNNVGIRYALQKSADYILLLNNDTIVHEDLLTELIKTAESDSNIGIVGPKIYFFDNPNRVWYVGGNIHLWTGRAYHPHYGETDNSSFDVKKEVDFVSGCALLIKRKVIEEIGLFDPRFFLVYEDADLNMRVHKAGYKIMYAPEAKLWHKVSISMKKISNNTTVYYHTRNAPLFVFKQKRLLPIITFIAYFILYHIVFQIMYHTIKKDFLKVRAILDGAIDAVSGRYGQKQ